LQNKSPLNHKKTKKSRYLKIDHILLSIPAGIENGEVITVVEKGHVLHNKIKGDVHIRIKISPHSIFERKGNDLHIHRKISLKESLCGFVLEIPHVNGKTLRLNHSATSHVIKPNDYKVIPSFGMMRENKSNGNLVIHFEIEFPEKMSDDQIQIIKDVL
jgi:DnaJ-class molecular chaperone